MRSDGHKDATDEVVTLRKTLLLSLCIIFSLLCQACTTRADPPQQSEAPLESATVRIDPEDIQNSPYLILSTQRSQEGLGIWYATPDSGAFSPFISWDDWVRDLIYVPQTHSVFALTQSGDIFYFDAADPSVIKTLDLPPLDEGETVNSISFAAETETVFVLTNFHIRSIPLPGQDGPSIIDPIYDEIKNLTIDSFSVAPNGTKYIVNISNTGYCFERGVKLPSIIPGSTCKFLDNEQVVYAENDTVFIYNLQTGEARKLRTFDPSIYGISPSDNGHILVWTGETGFTGGPTLTSLELIDIETKESASLSVPDTGMRITYTMIQLDTADIRKEV